VLNSITGRLTGKTKDSVYVDTGGVEWEIVTSATSLADLPEAGSEARVWVYLYHREATMQLYGFASVAERGVFLELLKVDGMGPRLATRVLSGMRPAELLRAVRDGDTASLSRVPGVGPKTAQKLVLALAGKQILEVEESGGSPPLARDLVAALAGMGFDRRDAQRAVEAALRELGSKLKDPAELEKQALREAIRTLGSSRGEARQQ
jgi:holliday junction DNA helicase RuvA